MTKLTNNEKQVNEPTWCIIYQDGVLISFIEYDNWIYTAGQYFEGTEDQCIAQIAILGLNTTEWNSKNPEDN